MSILFFKLIYRYALGDPTKRPDIWTTQYDHVVDVLMSVIFFDPLEALDYAIEAFAALTASADGDLKIPNRVYPNMLSAGSYGDSGPYDNSLNCGYYTYDPTVLRPCFMWTFNKLKFNFCLNYFVLINI